MEPSVQQNERTFIAAALGILIGIVLLVFLCWGGYRLYTIWESRHQSRRAAAYLSGGDLRGAALTARRALQLNPSNLPATRLLAEIAERINDRGALSLRRKAMELDPNSIDDALAFANCALQLKETATAENALNAIGEKGLHLPQFHAAAARLAEARKRIAEAEGHWAEAVRLAPKNTFYQLQFALALLHNPTRHRDALAKLKELRSDATQRAAATRALITNGMTHRVNTQTLAETARELQDYPEAIFSDRLLYLDILRQLDDPRFAGYYSELAKDAGANADNIAAFLSWMNANKMGRAAIEFAHSLPVDMQTKWPVPLTLAESYSKVSKWGAVQGLLQDKNWGDFDFMRHAYLSLAFRERGAPIIAEREWALAQKQAGSDLQRLSLLSRMVSEWGWKSESLDLLWLMAKHPEMQLEALQALYQKYAEAGDTPGLYRVLMRLTELLPTDRRIQNNLAQLRLLLNADVERAGKLAKELYAREPDNAAFASTYAFALYTKGKTDDALKIMSRLQESQLRQPALATYYGLLLAAAGKTDEAREYLHLAESGKLLPEEKELITKAEQSLK